MLNTYIISKNIDLPKEADIKHGFNPYKVAENIFMISYPVPYLIVKIANEVLKSYKPRQINSYKELKGFYLCGADYWKKDEIYVEHPRLPHCLIERALYKDYILREMVSDIANYIMDNMSISSITIGIVMEGKAKGDAGIPVGDVAVNASINCKLSSNYVVSMKNTKPHHTKKDYVWINMFPDVVTAVKHKSGSMEIVRETSMDFGGNVDFADSIKAVFGIEKSYKFYINYVRDVKN